jgi:RNA polymerase sigma-70 factor, ECF subfamily
VGQLGNLRAEEGLVLITRSFSKDTTTHMAHFAEVNIPGFVSISSSPAALERVQVKARADFKAIYEEHRHRIYSLAFWMTDNEVTAEEISARVFLRAFHAPGELNAQSVDNSLVYELRELTPIGPLTLNTSVASTKQVSGNTKRIHLELAVVQIPSTERMAFLLHDVEGYDHTRIAKTLGITEEESRKAVLQARILVRELIAEMI